MSRFRILAMALLGFALLPAFAGAQEASPPALATPTPDQCTVEPRTVEELQTLLSTTDDATAEVDLATPNTDAATPTPFVAPEGTRVTGDDGAPIVALVTEFYACQNANDTLRTYALMTDAFVVRTLQEGSIDPASLADLGTPSSEVLASEQRTIAINGIIQIDSEVYGVDVIGIEGSSGEEFTDYLIVTGSGDDLRIDDVQKLS